MSQISEGHIRTQLPLNFLQGAVCTFTFTFPLVLKIISFAAAWCDVLMELVDGVSWVDISGGHYSRSRWTASLMMMMMVNITEVNQTKDDDTKPWSKDKTQTLFMFNRSLA